VEYFTEATDRRPSIFERQPRTASVWGAEESSKAEASASEAVQGTSPGVIGLEFGAKF
jgi:hypothetical protein